MTRQEFIDSVNDFYTLIEFDRGEDIYILDDVKSADDLDEYVDDLIHDWVRRNTWQELRDNLADIPDGYEWYDTYDWIVGLTDTDFPEYKERMLEYLDDNGYWDDEEEEGQAVPMPIGSPVFHPMPVQAEEPFDMAGLLDLITVPA